LDTLDITCLTLIVFVIVNMRAQRRLPRDAAQQGLRGTQQGFQMSTARLLGKCSTAGAAKGVDLTVEKYYY
jgi:hypothetical protein